MLMASGCCCHGLCHVLAAVRLFLERQRAGIFLPDAAASHWSSCFRQRLSLLQSVMASCPFYLSQVLPVLYPVPASATQRAQCAACFALCLELLLSFCPSVSPPVLALPTPLSFSLQSSQESPYYLCSEILQNFHPVLSQRREREVVLAKGGDKGFRFLSRRSQRDRMSNFPGSNVPSGMNLRGHLQQVGEWRSCAPWLVCCWGGRAAPREGEAR